MAKMNTKRKTLSSFLTTLFPFIKTRIAFSLCCSSLYREQDLISYFENLIRVRVKEFTKAHGIKPRNQKRIKTYYIKQLPHLVKINKILIRLKGLLYLEEEERKGKE